MTCRAPITRNSLDCALSGSEKCGQTLTYAQTRSALRMSTMLLPPCTISRQSPSGTASKRHSTRSLTASARIVRRNLRVYVHPHRLGVGVIVHRLETHLAPVARVADAAERRAGIDALVAVDPDHAGAHRARHAM